MWGRLTVAAEEQPAEGTSSDPPEDDEPSVRRMRRAIRQIRREGWKIAIIYATVDAALVTLATNLLLTLWRPAIVPARVPIPAVVLDGLQGTVGVTLADPTVSAGAVIGVGLGLLTFGVEVALRVRRPLVEQFEAANPPLREALRTARDALDDRTDSRIARRLYGDVLAELRRSSSVGLVNIRRLTATVVIVAIVSLATIQLAVVDLSIDGFAGGDGTADGTLQDEYAGLQDPSGILGEREDVPTGENSMETLIGTSGSGGTSGSETDTTAGYDTGGFLDGASYESQQAGFAATERLEDAALIREYNLRIREGASE